MLHICHKNENQENEQTSVTTINSSNIVLHFSKHIFHLTVQNASVLRVVMCFSFRACATPLRRHFPKGSLVLCLRADANNVVLRSTYEESIEAYWSGTLDVPVTGSNPRIRHTTLTIRIIHFVILVFPKELDVRNIGQIFQLLADYDTNASTQTG